MRYTEHGKVADFFQVIAEYLQKVDPKSDGAKRDWVAIYDECANVLYQVTILPLWAHLLGCLESYKWHLLFYSLQFPKSFFLFAIINVFQLSWCSKFTHLRFLMNFSYNDKIANEMSTRTVMLHETTSYPS